MARKSLYIPKNTHKAPPAKIEVAARLTRAHPYGSIRGEYWLYHPKVKKKEVNLIMDSINPGRLNQRLNNESIYGSVDGRPPVLSTKIGEKSFSQASLHSNQEWGERSNRW